MLVEQGMFDLDKFNIGHEAAEKCQSNCVDVQGCILVAANLLSPKRGGRMGKMRAI